METEPARASVKDVERELERAAPALPSASGWRIRWSVECPERRGAPDHHGLKQ